MNTLKQATFPFYATFFPKASDNSDLGLERHFPSCVDMVKSVVGDDLKIRSTGVGYTLCLTHAEKTPSMRVKSNYINCFGCGAIWSPSLFYVSFAEQIGIIPALFNLDEPELREILIEDETLSHMEYIATKYGIIPSV